MIFFNFNLCSNKEIHLRNIVLSCQMEKLVMLPSIQLFPGKSKKRSSASSVIKNRRYSFLL